MPVPNPTMPVKGAGTTLWVYKGSGDPYANPLSDVDWSRLAKVKDLTPGELTAESYDDSYLDDEDADWTATGQGQKSAGDTSFTLAWMPGEQGQQALLAWFNEGDTRAYKIRFPSGPKRTPPASPAAFCISTSSSGSSSASRRFSRLKSSGCISGSLKNRLSTVYVSPEKCISSRTS